MPVEVSVLVAVRAGLDIAGTVMVHEVVDVVVVPTKVLPSGSLQFGFWNTSIRWVPAPTDPAIVVLPLFVRTLVIVGAGSLLLPPMVSVIPTRVELP